MPCSMKGFVSDVNTILYWYKTLLHITVKTTFKFGQELTWDLASMH